MTYLGVIKAFHYCKEQDDVWYFPGGNEQVVHHDLSKIPARTSRRMLIIWEREYFHIVDSRRSGAWVPGIGVSTGGHRLFYHQTVFLRKSR
jgi:hypothetical protein